MIRASIDDEALWNWLYDRQSVTCEQISTHCLTADLDRIWAGSKITEWEARGWIKVIGTFDPEYTTVVVLNDAPRLLTP